MTMVYGSSTIEPGGFTLDDDEWPCDCGCCGGSAVMRSWESCNGGSIDRHRTVRCGSCGAYYRDEDDSGF